MDFHHIPGVHKLRKLRGGASSIYALSFKCVIR
jgi:hypothetical protein